MTEEKVDLTRYRQKALAFMDGAKGAFSQHYQVFTVDGVDTGITKSVSRKSRNNPVVTVYTLRDGKALPTAKAAIAAYERSLQEEAP